MSTNAQVDWAELAPQLVSAARRALGALSFWRAHPF